MSDSVEWKRQLEEAAAEFLARNYVISLRNWNAMTHSGGDETECTMFKFPSAAVATFQDVTGPWEAISEDGGSGGAPLAAVAESPSEASINRIVAMMNREITEPVDAHPDVDELIAYLSDRDEPNA